MDANLKKFNSSFEYVLEEVFGMPGQKEKNEKNQYKNLQTTRLFADGWVNSQSFASL